MTTRDYTKPVAAGVALLDERGPEDWRAGIDPSTLDLGSWSDCVLGQLFGAVERGAQALGIKFGYGDNEATGLGFACGRGGSYDDLTAAWLAVL